MVPAKKINFGIFLNFRFYQFAPYRNLPLFKLEAHQNCGPNVFRFHMELVLRQWCILGY